MVSSQKRQIIMFPHTSRRFRIREELRSWLIDDKNGLLSKEIDCKYDIRYKPKTKHACELVKRAWKNAPGKFPPPVGHISCGDIVIFIFKGELIGDAVVEDMGFNKGDNTYPFWIKFRRNSVRVYPNRAIESEEFKRITGHRNPRQGYLRIKEIKKYKQILEKVADVLRKSLKSFESEEPLKP